jgi:hypothetical protein
MRWYCQRRRQPQKGVGPPRAGARQEARSSRVERPVRAGHAEDRADEAEVAPADRDLAEPNLLTTVSAGAVWLAGITE